MAATLQSLRVRRATGYTANLGSFLRRRMFKSSTPSEKAMAK